MGDVSGQQPKRPGESPVAPLLPAEQAWVRELPYRPAAAGALDANHVYIPLQDGGTVALARETGESVWTSPLGTPWPLVLAPTAVMVVTTDEVAALDRATGTTRWRVSLPARSIAAGVVAGDVLIVPLENGSLAARRLVDGAVAWTQPVEGLVGPVGLATDEKTLYVTTGSSRVTALTIASGESRWAVTLDGILSPPAVAGDRVFIGSTSNAFHALNADTGKREWTWGGGMVGGDVIGASVEGSTTFFVGLDNLLRAVNTGNGNQRWKQPTPTRPIAPPVAFGGVVAVFGVSPAIATFDARTGAPIGTFVLPTVAGATTAPIPKGPPIVDPELRPFRVAFVVVTADGRAFGLRPAGMMFRDPPLAPFAELPGKPLSRERLPTVPTPSF
jgi:outer membrane protein assembly factor BamB